MRFRPYLCIPVTFDLYLVLPLATNVPYEKMNVSAPFNSSPSVVNDVINMLRNYKKSEIQSLRTHLSKYRIYFSYFSIKKPNAKDMIIERSYASGYAMHENKNGSFDLLYTDWLAAKKKTCNKVSEMLCESIPIQILNI